MSRCHSRDPTCWTRHAETPPPHLASIKQEGDRHWRGGGVVQHANSPVLVVHISIVISGGSFDSSSIVWTCSSLDRTENVVAEGSCIASGGWRSAPKSLLLLLLPKCFHQLSTTPSTTSTTAASTPCDACPPASFFRRHLSRGLPWRREQLAAV